MENEDGCTTLFCLSFSSYTTEDRTAETAERVRLEFSDASNDEFEFPVFDQNLIDKDHSLWPTVTTQLRDLFLNEDSYSSSSSSDEEGLDVISSEMYRPWTPENLLKEGWRKSKSTGASSSTSWRIKDLLKRSYSEGKQTFKFLKSKSRNRDEFTKKKEKEKVEKFYVRNRAMREVEKKKLYLPHVFGFSFFNRITL